ncbi:putative cinnamoyl-CoA reductase [Helianthus annuus]|nr:cinnamoyl-CoA reductase 2 [Helianthus annuus]KAJ0538032.1 putative cinnamoyl-CoA reductase [Helianthus annuus]KAJ0552620.1 putative cinnamoyl-CoA reductase [Helianthus annuus]KAJ0718314.1 putative cinnamoyl-CoA reductase [Helianthus annuus]KAJ0721548.1 putative cinnamoyl-CoA reductase [Helianthus annuus]KAJ0896764.1 putative cinnamoyl-CoA reductase [Helianthus annuus]
MAAEKARVVCVTGAGGFVGSWLVKHLLSKNYTVHGTVRNPMDEKYGHLKKLEKASEKLKLFKADLLDYESIRAAIAGCDGVFHTASPLPPTSVPDPEVELIKPAVDGTLNVLKACCEVNVKKVVYVSSVAAVAIIPNRPQDRPLDETFWSDQEFCRSINEWYCLSKTKAESEAWEFSKKNGIDFLSVCPTHIFGPMLQKTVNFSSLVLIKHLKEGYEEVENMLRMIVDVRDLAEALILVYEKPEANGRYICVSHQIRVKDLIEILKKHYPDYNYPKKFIESKDKSSVTAQKLQDLGWSYRPLEETLVDSVENYAQNGLLG